MYNIELLNCFSNQNYSTQARKDSKAETNHGMFFIILNSQSERKKKFI